MRGEWGRSEVLKWLSASAADFFSGFVGSPPWLGGLGCSFEKRKTFEGAVAMLPDGSGRSTGASASLGPHSSVFPTLFQQGRKSPPPQKKKGLAVIVLMEYLPVAH